MHTFEVKIPISGSVCQKLLKIPHMERASERVFRSNCYAKKGIKQIELREYYFSMDGLNKVKIHFRLKKKKEKKSEVKCMYVKVTRGQLCWIVFCQLDTS